MKLKAHAANKQRVRVCGEPASCRSKSKRYVSLAAAAAVICFFSYFWTGFWWLLFLFAATLLQLGISSSSSLIGVVIFICYH